VLENNINHIFFWGGGENEEEFKTLNFEDSWGIYNS
jgi:hypothetical protein